MLMEFKVGNFLSFKDIEVLRMAQVLESDLDGTVFDEPTDLMLIYGANGSGKSNFIKAMMFSRDIAVRGFSDLSVGRYRGCRGPSYFEYVVRLDGVIYSYGFEIEIGRMELFSEWLYILEPEEDIRVYEYERGQAGIGGGKVSRCITEMNSSRDNEHMERVRRWLEDSVFIEGSRIRNEVIPVSPDLIDLLSSGLRRMDMGISEVREEPFRNTAIPENLIDGIANKGILRSDGDYLATIVGGKGRRSWLIHIIRRGGETVFRNVEPVHDCGHLHPLGSESIGTMRAIQMISLISMLQRDGGSDGLVIVDELECSVHSLVVDELIGLLTDTVSPTGQLVATTHRVNLLRNTSIDDRSISFMDMDREGDRGSRLYALSSMDHRMPDRHRAYMDGRMAAVPVFAVDR